MLGTEIRVRSELHVRVNVCVLSAFQSLLQLTGPISAKPQILPQKESVCACVCVHTCVCVCACVVEKPEIHVHVVKMAHCSSSTGRRAVRYLSFNLDGVSQEVNY